MATDPRRPYPFGSFAPPAQVEPPPVPEVALAPAEDAAPELTTVERVTVLTLQFPMDIERAAQALNALSAIFPGARLDGPEGGLIVSVVELRS